MQFDNPLAILAVRCPHLLLSLCVRVETGEKEERLSALTPGACLGPSPPPTPHTSTEAADKKVQISRPVMPILAVRQYWSIIGQIIFEPDAVLTNEQACVTKPD